MDQPTIFDRSARRRARDRAAHASAEDQWIVGRLVENVAMRLDDLDVQPQRALIMGALGAEVLAAQLGSFGSSIVFADPGQAPLWKKQAVQCDEDRLPFADACFDVILCPGLLDTVNDLPGALILFKRVLRDNGVLVASMLGSPSLGKLKRALAQTEVELSFEVQQHMHPQLDVRAMGDLLLRAGYVMPVVDIETVEVRYREMIMLAGDLRASAANNCLAGRHPMHRKTWTKTVANNAGKRFTDSLSIINLVAWKAAKGEKIVIGPQRGLNAGLLPPTR